MVLSVSDLHFLRDRAALAATKAGELIASYQSENVKVYNKKLDKSAVVGSSLASQVVTEVDYKSEALILEILEPTCKMFDLALLTEETPDDKTRFEKDYFWCIDPLDGTLPFTESRPGYAVSIGLVAKDGTSLIGVVYDPIEATLYSAIKGEGAFRNGETWIVSNSGDESGKSLTVVMDRSFQNHPLYEDVQRDLREFTSEQGWADMAILQLGGAVMNACWIATQQPACYFKFPKVKQGGGSLWDFAAIACLFTEAGGVVTDCYGEPLDLNRADSTFMNHKGNIFSTDKYLTERIVKYYMDRG